MARSPSPGLTDAELRVMRVLEPEGLFRSAKSGAVSRCRVCAGIMRENRDNGHAKFPHHRGREAFTGITLDHGRLGDGVLAALGKNPFDLGVRARNDVY